MDTHKHSANPGLSDQLVELSDALAKLQDSWVNLSFLLTERITESDSPERDAILSEVKVYLRSL